jgi:hypothetical protein
MVLPCGAFFAPKIVLPLKPKKTRRRKFPVTVFAVPNVLTVSGDSLADPAPADNDCGQIFVEKKIESEGNRLLLAESRTRD